MNKTDFLKCKYINIVFISRMSIYLLFNYKFEYLQRGMTNKSILLPYILINVIIYIELNCKHNLLSYPAVQDHMDTIASNQWKK